MFQDVKLWEMLKEEKRKMEGLKLEAYLCPAKVLTIGYGHTGPDVYKGKVITEQEAELLLESDMQKTFQQLRALLRKHGINNLNSNIKAGILSLAFNIGVGRISSSSIISRLKNGDIVGAGLLIGSFRMADGKYPAGLQYRRAIEMKIYFGMYNSEYKILPSKLAFPIWVPDRELTLRGRVIKLQEYETDFKFSFQN